MFKTNKKLVAAILSAALALSSVSAAFAAQSPTAPDIPAPGEQEIDSKKQSTTNVMVTDGSSITATGVKDVENATVGGNATLESVSGEPVTATVNALGTGALKPNKKTKTLKTTKTVTTIESKAIAGSKVKKVVSTISKSGTLRLKSKALADSKLKVFETDGSGTLVVGYRTFAGTSVSSVKIRASKVDLRQGSFIGVKKGTKTKISFGGIKKASDLSAAVGAFKSNSKNMTIIFGKNMSKKEFKKAVKKLKKSGFQGRIKHNT